MRGNQPTVGVIGLGIHARSVLLPALTLAGARIVGVHDADAEHTASACLMTQAYCATSADDLVDVARPDCVIVATPPGPAADIVGTLIDRRLPIFVEKPVSLAADEVRALAEQVEASRGVVQVGFNRRHAPAYRQLRSLLVKAGRPVSLALRLAVEAPAGLSGFLRDAAIHQLDLCRFLLGDTRDVVGYRAAGNGSGALFLSAVVTGGNGVAVLNLCGSGSWGYPTEHVCADLSGISIDVSDVSSLTVHRAGRQRMDQDRASELDHTSSAVWQANPANPRLLNNSLYLQGYLPQLQQFLKAVSLGAPATPGLRDAAAALDLADLLVALPVWGET
jgi:predicted dehydrogenase